jgi:hypothetical protein
MGAKLSKLGPSRMIKGTDQFRAAAHAQRVVSIWRCGSSAECLLLPPGAYWKVAARGRQLLRSASWS